MGDIQYTFFKETYVVATDGLSHGSYPVLRGRKWAESRMVVRNEGYAL